MGGELQEYVRITKELSELNYEMSMVNRLVEKAQQELDYKTLNAIRHYMSILLQKLGELQARRIQLEQKLEKAKPTFIKAIDRVEYQAKQILDLIRDVTSGRISLSELWRDLSAVKNYVPKLLQDIEKSKQIINKLMAEEPSISDQLKLELNRIKRTERILKLVFQAVMVDPTQIIRYKKLIGTTVIIEPDNLDGIISDVLVDAGGKIYLEISEEDYIDHSVLELLFRDIGFDFGATDLNDFKTKFLRRMQSRLGRKDLKPSLIQQFLSVEGLIQYLSNETKSKLEPQFKVLGFVPTDVIESWGAELRIEKNQMHARLDSLIRCPSIRTLPERALNQSIRLKGKYYRILLQTFLPEVGRVVVVMQQDKNGEPLPDVKLLEKIFYYLSKQQNMSEEQKGWVVKAVKLLKTKKQLEEVFLMLRVIITKSGIKVKDELAESNALRPAYVFLFAMKNRIPLTYSEILSHYLYYINTDYLEYAGRQVRVKVPVSPGSLLSALKLNYLKLLVGFVCGEFLGFQVDKNRLILLCAQPINKEIVDAINQSYGTNFDASLSPSQIIKLLILHGKIKTSSDYRSLLDALGVQRIIYNEIIEEFEDSDELVIAHAFVMNLMKMVGGFG